MGVVALWGASGAIGHTVAKAFRDRGRPYRVVGRSVEALTKHFGADPLAQIVAWDPSDQASVRKAAEGVDAIVYLVGVDYARFDLHPVLTKATLEGAIAAGVERFLLIGTLYSYGQARTSRIREDHPREPQTRKGKFRNEQDNLVLDADRSGKIRTAILRLPDFYGPGVDKSLVAGIFAAAAAKKTASLLGPLDTPHEYVYVPDVGPVVAELVDEPRAYGHVWHLGGAGTITSRALIEDVERITGRKLKKMVANKTMLRMLGLFDPLMRELVEMNYLNTHPLIMDDSAIHTLLGPIHKTTYGEGVRQIMASLQAS